MPKTDNHDSTAKLDLRRYFLRKYHADDPPHVLDCCQGSGLLWGTLRQEFAIASYWGVDVKPKKGRLKIDSIRILQQPGWLQNVVDIDTYGLPWKHWFAMMPRITRPTTAFLTIGSTATGMGSYASQQEIDSLGLGFRKLKLPPSFTLKIIRELAVSYCLTRGCGQTTIIEAVEALSDGNARYIGVRLEPRQNTDGQQVRTAGRPKRKQAAKEPADV